MHSCSNFRIWPLIDAQNPPNLSRPFLCRISTKMKIERLIRGEIAFASLIAHPSMSSIARFARAGKLALLDLQPIRVNVHLLLCWSKTKKKIKYFPPI